jgi:signal transduction histidine kinase
MRDDEPADVLRLLLIEDDPDSGEAQKAALESRGLHVTHCTGAEDALEVFGPDNFDVMVSDIRLDGMSGVELLRAVREQSSEFPVILLTGYESIETATEAVRLGAQDYILKPLDTIDDLARPAVYAAEAYRTLIKKRELERELQEREMQLRALAVELQSIREEERKKLSRCLHDELGQLLTGMRLSLAWVSSCLPDEQREQRDKLDTLCSLSEEMIKTVQRISADLRPAILDELGIGAAAEWLVERFREDTGIKYDMVIDTDCDAGSEAVQTALYRALQEALTNVVRHANASRVDISLTHVDDSLVMTVRDDGVGIDEAQIYRRSSLGLMGMRERIASVAGEVRIEGSPGNGTAVTVVVPVDEGPGEPGEPGDDQNTSC